MEDKRSCCALDLLTLQIRSTKKKQCCMLCFMRYAPSWSCSDIKLTRVSSSSLTMRMALMTKSSTSSYQNLRTNTRLSSELVILEKVSTPRVIVWETTSLITYHRTSLVLALLKLLRNAGRWVTCWGALDASVALSSAVICPLESWQSRLVFDSRPFIARGNLT